MEGECTPLGTQVSANINPSVLLKIIRYAGLLMSPSSISSISSPRSVWSM